MPEALPAFVARRRPDWEGLEALLRQRSAGPLPLSDLETLDRLYRRATSDLAHAQAFYRGTDVDRFLNQLCARAYGSIYRSAPHRLASFQRFFQRDFPRTLRRERRYVAASALLFGLGIAVGAAAVLFSPTGAELLVPEAMRDKVLDHQMWTDGILSAAPPGVVASAIATNNLSVVVAAFALGATLGVGTVLVLVGNGVHLGSVAVFCAQHDMAYPLGSFIGAHGPVELSIVVIAGAAGLILGHALVAPGEHSRAVALRTRSAEAVKLVLGCAPFLAAIGVVEGFVSPGALFPGWVKIPLGLALGAAFWFYLWRAGSDARPPDSAVREVGGSR